MNSRCPLPVRLSLPLPLIRINWLRHNNNKQTRFFISPLYVTVSFRFEENGSLASFGHIRELRLLTWALTKYKYSVSSLIPEPSGLVLSRSAAIYLPLSFPERSWVFVASSHFLRGFIWLIIVLVNPRGMPILVYMHYMSSPFQSSNFCRLIC